MLCGGGEGGRESQAQAQELAQILEAFATERDTVLDAFAHDGYDAIFAGQDIFNEYSHKLISNPLVYVAEIGLLAMTASAAALAVGSPALATGPAGL